MISRKSRFLWSLLSAGFVIFLLVFPVLAQEDPNPNSPTPVLLSEPGSTRVLATVPGKPGRVNFAKIQSQAFSMNQKVILYVTNVELMNGEEASAFRVFVEDQQGRRYRFPVLEIEPVKGQEWIYALTVLLRDEIEYFEPLTGEGDVLVEVTWRGLVSNRVKLGIGAIGGKIKDDAGAVPTPAPISPPKKSDEPTTEYVGYRWSGDRIRFLEQATFGPTQALDDRIRRIGLRIWLAEQFEAPYPSAANPYPNVPLQPINPIATCDGAGTDDVPPTCYRDSYSMYLPQTWFYKEAFYGEPQLKHRVSWALSQIWVISGVDTQQSSWMITYHQQLSKNAFGNWRNLMQDMTLNPAMGNYLDMIRSTKNSPNENYPREVLQLFNIGLFMLNQNGTLQLDGMGNPIPTYDQTTVNNFTKVFTGWRDCNVQASCPNLIPGSPDYKDPMLLVPGNHDVTAKTLLSYPGSTTTSIAACAGCSTAQITTYANNSLNQALDNIYNHPNVAPFVSKFLIQQLVTDDPTPAYIGRISAVFNAYRTSPTQMKEVIKAILLDPEARGDVKTDPQYGKLREPVQLMTNLFRHFNVSSADGLSQSDGNVNRFNVTIGQDVFRSPTVFNYYPPDYVVPGTTLLGPEFAIFNTGTSIARANLANTFVFSQINASPPDQPTGTKLNFADLQALSAADSTGNLLVDHLNQRMMHGAMSAQMKSTILTAVQAASATDTLLRARTAVYLIVTSSQYQVQR